MQWKVQWCNHSFLQEKFSYFINQHCICNQDTHTHIYYVYDLYSNFKKFTGFSGLIINLKFSINNIYNLQMMKRKKKWENAMKDHAASLFFPESWCYLKAFVY